MLGTAGIIAVPGGGNLDFDTSRTSNRGAPLIAGWTNQVIASWDIGIPPFESVQLESLDFRVDIFLGTAYFANLTAWSGGHFLGTMQPLSGMNTFYFLSFLTSPSTTSTLDFRADILSGSYGTVEINVLKRGLHGRGVSSNNEYTSAYDVYEVPRPIIPDTSTNTSSPEPTTFILVLSAAGFIFFQRRKTVQ